MSSGSICVIVVDMMGLVWMRMMVVVGNGLNGNSGIGMRRMRIDKVIFGQTSSTKPWHCIINRFRLFILLFSMNSAFVKQTKHNH